MDNVHIATLAQLIVAGLPESRAELVAPIDYRERPDFEALHRIEQSYVPGSPPPSPPKGSWLAFVFCKPSVEAGKLLVHVLEPSDANAPAADELWIKLKRAEVVHQLDDAARAVDSPAAIVNRAIVQWAASQVKTPTSAIVCEADIAVSDGPLWLRTSLDVSRSGNHVSVRSPSTQTPVDAPPRFAGMHYMKVISPSWAVRTLRGT